MELTEGTQDWYDGWIEDAEEMKIRVISDTHWNHDEAGGVMQTKCKRPENFTDLSLRNWRRQVQPTDLVIHCGDVIIGPKRRAKDILASLPGRKVLVRGNHDRDKACSWWMENGFEFACDFFVLRGVLFTHEPANVVIKSDGHLPYEQVEPMEGDKIPFKCEVNVHGHLHNVWDGFMDPKRLERDKAMLDIDYTKQLKYPWQRLFALEYTNYSPVELNEFLAHPEKYQATGPRKTENG